MVVGMDMIPALDAIGERRIVTDASRSIFSGSITDVAKPIYPGIMNVDRLFWQTRCTRM
jgi:hypothetical protein